jgi:hypothetical protein
MAVGARHRFSLEVAFRVQKATAKFLNDAFYAILCCQIKKLPWSVPGKQVNTTQVEKRKHPLQVAEFSPRLCPLSQKDIATAFLVLTLNAQATGCLRPK